MFDADNGAMVGVVGSAYKIDTALLEATAPLLNLKGGTVLATSDNAIDLVNRAKVSIPNDAVSMVTLRSSALIVANGHLVNVAGGSVLNIAGNIDALSIPNTVAVDQTYFDRLGIKGLGASAEIRDQKVEVVAVTKGKLDFGPWEQIFYGEFDGNRPKRVLVKVIGE